MWCCHAQTFPDTPFSLVQGNDKSDAGETIHRAAYIDDCIAANKLLPLSDYVYVPAHHHAINHLTTSQDQARRAVWTVRSISS